MGVCGKSLKYNRRVQGNRAGKADLCATWLMGYLVF